MFKRTSETNIEVSVRPPLIYLDHCAIRAISSEPKSRAHLRETFQTRGTLMFSVVNMLEMARNSGPSYERIRDLLDDLGPYWLPSDQTPTRFCFAKWATCRRSPSSFRSTSSGRSSGRCPLAPSAWARRWRSSTTPTSENVPGRAREPARLLEDAARQPRAIPRRREVS